MKDVQNCTFGFPKVPLPWVGVTNVLYPVYVFYPGWGYIMSTGTFNLYCSLKPDYKGIHMSRFYSIVEESFSRKKFLSENVKDSLESILTNLESEDARLEVKLTYFYDCISPTSHILQKLPIEVQVTGIGSKCSSPIILVSVKAPYTSLCPCSKEISEGRGAHNQRSFASITVEMDPRNIVTFETLIEIVEASASAPIRECLKRVDEREVTIRAYENPRFVEDMVRQLSERLLELKLPYLIKVIHQESIHAHDAVAYLWSDDFKLTQFNYLGGC